MNQVYTNTKPDRWGSMIQLNNYFKALKRLLNTTTESKTVSFT